MSAFASLTTVTRIAGPALPGISFAARLPAAICPIATLLMLTELDSIGTAGIAAGMLWTGQAVGGPFLGRLADRRGHRPVILAASLANTAAIALFVASALTAMPLVVQAALAAVAGLTVPQIGPLSRTRWIVLTDPKKTDNPSHTRELTRRAHPFDTTVDELGLMAGPALAWVTVVLIHPAAGLVLAGLVMAVFGTFFALHPTAPGGTPARASAPARLLHPALLALFAMALYRPRHGRADQQPAAGAGRGRVGRDQHRAADRQRHRHRGRRHHHVDRVPTCRRTLTGGRTRCGAGAGGRLRRNRHAISPPPPTSPLSPGPPTTRSSTPCTSARAGPRPSRSWGRWCC